MALGTYEVLLLTPVAPHRLRVSINIYDQSSREFTPRELDP